MIALKKYVELGRDEKYSLIATTMLLLFFEIYKRGLSFCMQGVWHSLNMLPTMVYRLSIS